MKTILLTLTYAVGIGELILAAYFWVTNSKSEIRRVMALLAFSTGMWVVTTGASSYTNGSGTVDFLLKAVYVFGVFLITALVHLAIVFPYPMVRLDRLHRFLLYVPALIFSYIALFTNEIVRGLQANSDIPGIVFGGPLYTTYNIFLLVMFVITLWLLGLKIRRQDGLTKNNTQTVFWSILIGGSLPVWYDLLIPNFVKSLTTSSNYLYANIATIVWLGMTTYIVRKK